MSVSLLRALDIDEGEVASVLDGLRARGETVATAESLTAGLVCAVLTAVPGASDVVRGGLVVYATDLKSGLAGVDRQLLDRHGPVHPDVAERLAAGAARRCGATWGMGLTGVAGPGQQDGVPAGTVYLGLAGPPGAAGRLHRFDGDREEVRAASARVAIRLLAWGLARGQASPPPEY